MPSRKKTTAEDRETEKQIKQETSLAGNLWQLQDFLQGKKSASDISAGKSYGKTKDSIGDEGDFGNLDKPRPFSMDVDGLAENLGNPTGGYNAPMAKTSSTKAEYTLSKSGNWILKRSQDSPSQPYYESQHTGYYQPSISQNDINQVVNDIISFRFSGENKGYEVAEIRKAIASVLDKLKAERIADNSRQIAKSAKKFFRTSSGGIKAVYSILGQEVTMLVEGSFDGDETFYLTVEGDEPVGVVMKRDHTGRYVNASDSYDISVNRQST